MANEGPRYPVMTASDIEVECDSLAGNGQDGDTSCSESERLKKRGSSIPVPLTFFIVFSWCTLGSRGYFFLIDISRRSRVNEAQSAEEKKITSGHRST